MNDSYEVFDLEHNDGTTIQEYSNAYSWNWKDKYYNNLKIKIKEYERKRDNQ